ncbi:MAG TPA: NAD(P)/FAD-dependent oxidoreductase [Allocoleopsis sp.]
MTTRKLNRRDFIGGLSQSALSLLVFSRATQQLVASASQPTSVLVLGAGLSGLYTALLLEAKGLSVTVLEARDRVGGRVHTLNDIPGKPEAGGQSFNEKYQRLLALAERLQVHLEPAVGLDKEMLLYVRKQTVLPKHWAGAGANQLAANERRLIPPLLLSHYLRQNNPLQDATAWTNSQYAALDIPLVDYLRSEGASTEALRLMNCHPGSLMNSVETASSLCALRNDQRGKIPSKQSLHIQDGNSRLPEKMAAALKSPVQMNKVVEAIRSRDRDVEVHCTDGSTFRADYAVVTLPFSVLREVEIKPRLPAIQAEAIQELNYTPVTQIRFTVREPFWEKDGYPPMMWTDSALQSIFPVRDRQGKVQSLVCWVSGEGAKKLDAMSTTGLEQLVRSQLKQIRPGVEENMEIVRVVSWGRDPFARGAYSHFGPGQIRRFQHQMAQPWQRLHFAGEHTAISSPGMESALESAERVAQEILTRME